MFLSLDKSESCQKELKEIVAKCETLSIEVFFFLINFFSFDQNQKF